jgi:hypothetical protein
MESLGALEFHLAKFEFGPHVQAFGTKFRIFDDLRRLAKKAWRGPSKAAIRALPFIRDNEYRQIAERDLASFASMEKLEETKLALALGGSVVESILLDLLEKDTPKTVAAATAVQSKMLPKKSRTWSGFKPGDSEWWTLEQVIAVCGPDGLGVLAERTMKMADLVRDYRNYIHPRKERSQILDNASLIRADAITVRALMESVIEQVEKWRAAHP